MTAEHRPLHQRGRRRYVFQLLVAAGPGLPHAVYSYGDVGYFGGLADAIHYARDERRYSTWWRENRPDHAWCVLRLGRAGDRPMKLRFAGPTVWLFDRQYPVALYRPGRRHART